ncbi:hypothetical protein CIB84_009411, partial [Bambusicola thoracicus]
MGTCSTLKTCLDAFKEAVQQKLQEAQIKLMADNEHKLAFLKQEKKAEIYQSLVVSIQNDLLLCYEEAAAVRGQQAYQRMQTILSNGIMRAVESGMFERAENSMREHLQNMKEQITKKLEEDFSNMLSLAFCPWDQLDGKLPAPFSADGDSAAVTPRKQPRLQLPFQQEEQKTLRIYENIESKARKILSTSSQKMTHLFLLKDMPVHLAYLRDRITTLDSRPALEPLYIGLFGSSGAGKSTLLNTILGKRFFLPVSGTRTCTSCQEWKEEVRNLVTLLENRHENSETDGDLEHAIKVLKTIYGEGADEKSYEDLIRTKPVITIPPSRVITLRKTEDGLEGVGVVDNSQCSEQMRLWPLIKQVQVTLPPSELVPEGVIFVDIPGTGDANKKRDEMWKESILQCTSIWIVADVERVFGAKAHEIMVQEAIKACQVGKCSDITFVITKMDKINVDEYL